MDVAYVFFQMACMCPGATEYANLQKNPELEDSSPFDRATNPGWEEEMMRAYHGHLIGFGGGKVDYPYDKFRDDVKATLLWATIVKDSCNPLILANHKSPGLMPALLWPGHSKYWNEHAENFQAYPEMNKAFHGESVSTFTPPPNSL